MQQSVSLGRHQDHPGGHSSLWHGLVHFVCVCVCVPHKYTVHTQREPAMSRPSTVLSSSSYQEEGLGYANMFLPQGLWIRGCEQFKEVLFTCQHPASQTQLKWLLLPLGRSSCPLDKRSESSYSLP